MASDPNAPESASPTASPAAAARAAAQPSAAAAAQAAAPAQPAARSTIPAAWAPDDPAFEARVLRAFFRDARLASIPARERKKLVVYRHLVDQVFADPGEVVHERDVNMRLALWHPDVATIRRALADLGFVRRDGMAYRRAVPLRTSDRESR